MDAADRMDRVLVIGAGSSGLAAAKNLRGHGLAVDVLEREHELGGLWNYGRPQSVLYHSTRMISSKPFTQYPDFPMPAGYPDYPHHTQVLDYLRSYARHFGLDEAIEYGSPVERLAPVDGGAAWEATVGTGERRRYGAVVVASGHHRSPRWPEFPGEFAGEVMHAASYRTPDVLRGRRVLVVGGGNSGCDIVVEAAQFGDAAFHSTRRGYHYIPKYVLGRPADQVGDLMLKLRLPLPLRRWLARLAIRLTIGTHEQIGLPEPDHRLWETHPIVNSLLPYFVRHGGVAPRPDIERFDGRRVRFTDGTAEEVDLVVYATGYRVGFPFLDDGELEWPGGRPRLWRNVFHPRYDTLFFAGLIQPDSGQFGLVHWQTRAIAGFLAGARAGLPAADRLRERKARPEADDRPIRYRDSPRHALEVEHWSYRQALRELADELPESAPPARRGAPAG